MCTALAITAAANGRTDGRTSIEIELDMRVFLLLIAVVVRPALDDLHAAQLDVGARRLGGYEAAERNDGCDGEGDRGEEAEDVLQAHQGRMHLGECVWGDWGRGRFGGVDAAPAVLVFEVLLRCS